MSKVKAPEKQAQESQPLVLEPEVMMLTGIESRQKRLQLKIEEYRERIKELASELKPEKARYKAPEIVRPMGFIFDELKLRVSLLQKLLKNGKLNGAPIMKKELTDRQKELHYRAWEVIHAYNARGGNGLNGGTGLPKLPRKRTAKKKS